MLLACKKTSFKNRNAWKRLIENKEVSDKWTFKLGEVPENN